MADWSPDSPSIGFAVHPAQVLTVARWEHADGVKD
jgi:hypothetical protein